MKTLRYMLLAVATTLSISTAWALDDPKNTGFVARVGYTLGGTSPIPLPAQMRHINEFSPKGGATIGLDAYRMFNKHWGVQTGMHFFYQGFHTSADVKSYKMRLEIDGNEMGGYFTGTDVTNTDMWGTNIVLQAKCNINSRWSLAFGPFLSTYFKTRFYGDVRENKDGVAYLRVDAPTGERVGLDGRQTPYDFSKDMRKINGGIDVTVDCRVMNHLNVFGMLDWGLSNVFNSNFKETIPFKMFPIYATLGVAYQY